MEELLFYTVDKNYIKYLRKFETHISYNNYEIGHSRPYKDLISAEYRYINSNKEEIYKRANKMYIAVTRHKKNFLKTTVCNFKLLEEKSIKYKSEK